MRFAGREAIDFGLSVARVFGVETAQYAGLFVVEKWYDLPRLQAHCNSVALCAENYSLYRNNGYWRTPQWRSYRVLDEVAPGDL